MQCPVCKKGSVKIKPTIRQWYECQSCKTQFSEKLIADQLVIDGDLKKVEFVKKTVDAESKG